MDRMSENAARLREAFLLAWNTGSTEGMRELFHPDYRRHAHSTEDGRSAQEFLDSIAATRNAFPDLVSEVDDLVIGCDQVVMRWLSKGTHTGSFLSVPPTRRPVKVAGVTFSRFVDGLVIEEWVTWDARELLASVGVLQVGGE